MRRCLIYGDSNSYGTAPMRSLQEEAVHERGVRWGDVMARALGNDWDVVIEGLPGRSVALDDPMEGEYRNGLKILPAILHSHKPIDLMIICLGANDQKARFGLRAQDVALALARMVREAQATETVGRILVVAQPPVRERGDFREMFQGAEARCAGLAAQIERFVRAEGADFFDAAKVIAVDDLDGIHWSRDSHAKFGAAMADAVRALFE